MKKEYYKGYSITFDAQKDKFKARFPSGKTFASHQDIDTLKLGIDGWERNSELSARIDATPQGISPNPNVAAMREKDNHSGY